MSNVISVGEASDFPASVWGTKDKATRALPPLGDEKALVPVPTHLLPAFELNPRRKAHAADRRAAADRVLEQCGIRPRR